MFPARRPPAWVHRWGVQLCCPAAESHGPGRCWQRDVASAGGTTDEGTQDHGAADAAVEIQHYVFEERSLARMLASQQSFKRCMWRTIERKGCRLSVLWLVIEGWPCDFCLLPVHGAQWSGWPGPAERRPQCQWCSGQFLFTCSLSPCRKSMGFYQKNFSPYSVHFTFFHLILPICMCNARNWRDSLFNQTSLSLLLICPFSYCAHDPSLNTHMLTMSKDFNIRSVALT